MSQDEIRDQVSRTVRDLVADFCYYDRKECEDLPRDVLEAAVRTDPDLVDIIVDDFSTEIRDWARRLLGYQANVNGHYQDQT